MHKIVMLGTGLIGRFYTMALHGQRSRDRVQVVYSRSAEHAPGLCRRVWHSGVDNRSGRSDCPSRCQMRSSSACPTTATKKRCSCQPPPARPSFVPSHWDAPPPRPSACSIMVEQAGIFHGYLEDLAYTPKAIKGDPGCTQWARWAKSSGPARARPIPAPTATGSGIRSSRGAAPSLTSAAIVLRLAAISSASKYGPLR